MGQDAAEASTGSPMQQGSGCVTPRGQEQDAAEASTGSPMQQALNGALCYLDCTA
jgi:hypothetical protein